MMLSKENYPQAKVDSDNEKFFEGWKSGVLTLQKCGECDTYLFPPRVHCPHCWGDALTWHAVDDAATIISYAVIYRPNHPAFFAEAPIILAELKLRCGATMLARVLAQDTKQIEIGREAKLVTGTEAQRFSLPTFEIA